ncbi:MAG: TAT-variant-translocated molybdopterin oxidoreductase [Acidobacteria bacterium]|nr:TAT-variant-translocated molybdopterin oxidoreductase [Acidobacteriota bacterium]
MSQVDRARRAAAGGRAYRSLDQLADSPEFRRFAEHEFGVAMPEFAGPATRRTFLKLMGASLAMAGLVSCRWPKEKILPYARRPDGRVPGLPEQYATFYEDGIGGLGLLVTSFDGRPIKVEGNPQHPLSGGATDAHAQASVLSLYDPDRARDIVRREGGREFVHAWDDFAAHARQLGDGLRARGGEGFAVLAEPSASPSLARLRGELLSAAPRALWYEYAALDDHAGHAGTALAFGSPQRPLLRLAEADVVVSFECDFLGLHPASVLYGREFAARRRAEDGTMNRLYALESALTLTGANADQRVALASREVGLAALHLAAALGLAPAPAGAQPPEIVGQLARELREHAGRSVLVAGPTQPAEVHAAVALLNHALGNAGRTVVYLADGEPRAPYAGQIAELTRAIDAGAVSTLFVLGGNPAYDAPAALAFAEKLEHVPETIRLGLYRDETSLRSTWHVPRAHYLESWSDGRAYDGTVSIVQPLIEPLYGGRTPAEVLALLLGSNEQRGYDIVRATFAGGGPIDEGAWAAALHEGVVPGSAPAPAAPVPADGAREALARFEAAPAAGPQQLELTFVPDAKVLDGRFANNAWLQEMPGPLTKLTWDNAALVGPGTAEELGIENGDVVAITHEGRRLEIAAYVIPGQARNSIALPLGYGRTAAGVVANGVGFDVNRLRPTGGLPVAHGARLEATGRRHAFATTQDHWAMDRLGREELQRRVPELLKVGSLQEYREHPQFAKDETELFSLWTEPQYTGYAWAMAIDLAACTGCNACVMACQSENNIPVVGKEQVANGREMHWLRVDRYFLGDPEAPAIGFQPVPCMHCENAPCEQVCPVNASVHDAEGLNQQVYNRCVGTRYCSNNCPYKVRRFNFFNYQKHVTPLQAMVYNPDVTVRSRGVMEKCTYCVQRIEAARIQAIKENRPIRDGDITPACAQSCPTQAIVFGDRNDPESRIARLQKHPRTYSLLAELNVQPRTRYMARLTNPPAGATGAAGPAGEHHS